MMTNKNENIIEVENLKVFYPTAKALFEKQKYVKAVDDVSFHVRKGEVFGIVGESGCGKSTLSRGICRLEEITSGKISLDGKDITTLNNRDMRPVRKKIQMIFQDPYSSLDPRMTVFDIVAEPLLEYKLVSNKIELEKRVIDLLKKVGLDEYHAYRYPHEFSGGQRQRVGIARALAVEPQLIIADEPVSALDVSIQAQVLNLLNQLKKEFNLTYIFIAHDLSVVEFVSDRIGVMYLGDFVEVGSKEEIYKNPCHPYTQGLLSAVPVPDPDAPRNRIMMKGNIPSALNPPSGCRFHTRCEHCMEICTMEIPLKHQVGKDHYVACHLFKDEKEGE